MIIDAFIFWRNDHFSCALLWEPSLMTTLSKVKVMAAWEVRPISVQRADVLAMVAMPTGCATDVSDQHLD